jgi:glycopeptide antibiotics resistance protein
VKWFTQGSLRFRALTVAFVLYLIALTLFTFFPRPILETGDPTAIAMFLESHANFFYKILYANTTSVAIGNYFMLTPFIVMARLVYPQLSLRRLILMGVGVSATIEISQIFIPGRVSDFLDFISNSLSLLWGIFAIKALERIERKGLKTRDS